MQEEVDQKTIALSMKTGKLTAQVLQAALKKYLQMCIRDSTSSVLSYCQLCLQIFSSTCKIVATFRELCVKIKQNAKVGDWLAG